MARSHDQNVVIITRCEREPENWYNTSEVKDRHGPAKRSILHVKKFAIGCVCHQVWHLALACRVAAGYAASASCRGVGSLNECRDSVKGQLHYLSLVILSSNTSMAVGISAKLSTASSAAFTRAFPPSRLAA